jgi:RNA polymerase sigma factor (sigma-70 family)
MATSTSPAPPLSLGAYEVPRGLPRRVTITQERAMVRAAIAGERGGRDELVDAFLPSIGTIARRYRNHSAIDRDELMQEGVVGLLRALERFEPARGTPFWAYASWWVRQAMQQLVAELTRPMVLSDRALRQLARVRGARAERLQADGAEPTIRDLVEETGFPREHVESLLAAERSSRALEEPTGAGGERIGALGDLIADPRAEDEYERVDGRVFQVELTHLPHDLTERERMILVRRYGLDGPEETLREIGCNLKLSAERVRQIEERALDKLRVHSGLEPRHAPPVAARHRGARRARRPARRQAPHRPAVSAS